MVQVGIDIDGDQARVARVSNDLGRPVVERLVRVRLGEISGQSWLNAGAPVFSISDERTQVKTLHLSPTSAISFREAGQFELAQSILDDDKQFLFATYPTRLESNYVGTIVRSDLASTITEMIGFAPRNGLSSDSFIPRAAALGAGYLTYCQTEPGELTGLVDLTGRAGSICLIYKGKIVTLGNITLCRASDNGTLDHKQTVVQTKMLFNLLMSRLSSNVLNLPMATLVLSGAESSPELAERFKSQFSCGVISPRQNRSYLTDALADRGDLSEYLVAMGLAFNSLARPE